MFKKAVKIRNVKTEAIAPPSFRTRRNESADGLPALAQSVEQNGMIQPLLVCKDKQGYRLIAGTRRLDAAKAVGLKTVPVIVVQEDMPKTAILALAENLHREHLHYFEMAYAFKMILKNGELSKQALGKLLGVSEHFVEQKLELLALSEREVQLASEGELSEQQVRAVLRLPENERETMIIEAAAKSLSTQQTEQRVCEMLNERYVTGGSRTHIAVKDVRIFINTITRAVEVMNEAGLDATAERRDTDRYIEFLIKIPYIPEKRRRTPKPSDKHRPEKETPAPVEQQNA